MATYKNPWHKAGEVDTYGPEFYQTDVKPMKVGPYLVYQRLKGVCWDWVKDGVCITQRAGFDGKIPEGDLLLKS